MSSSQDLDVKKVDFAKLKKIPIKVDVEKMLDNVKDIYDDLARAFQKECIQNSDDAYRFALEKKRLDESHVLRIVMGFDSKNKRFFWKDNAGGMPDDVFDDKFHAIGPTTKAGLKLGGSRGQGKSVLPASGEYLITETRYKGKHKCKIWKGSFAYEYKSEKLKEDGTWCELFNIAGEIAIALADAERMVRNIQCDWGELLKDKNVKITYVVDGRSVNVKPVDVSAFKPIQHKSFKSIIIKKGKKQLGIIENLDLYYCEEELPEDARGVAINVFRQTIKRHNLSYAGSQAKKLFGTCNAPFLHESEESNHCDFRFTPEWIETKTYLNSQIAKFLEPFMKISKTADSRIRKLADDVLEELNECLKFVSELDPSGTMVSKPKGERPEPYIRYISLNRRIFVPGEEIIIKTGVLNPSKRQIALKCRLHALLNGPEEAIVFSDGKMFDLGKSKSTVEQFKFKIKDDVPLGDYSLIIKLYSPEKGLIDEVKTSLSILTEILIREREQEAEKKKRKRGKEKKRKGSRRTGGLRGIIPGKQPEGQEPAESEFDPESYSVLINIDYPTYGLAQRNKTIKEHIFRCSVNELAHYKLTKDSMECADSLNPDKIAEIHKKIMLLQQRLMARRALNRMK